MNNIFPGELCKILNRIQIAINDDLTSNCSTLEDGIASVVDGVPVRKLFIGNLAQRTTYLDLGSFFSKYGPVECCYLKRNLNGHNYAFVTFKNTADAKKARIEGMNRLIEIHNRCLRVMAADSWHQPDSAECKSYKSNDHKEKVCLEDSNDCIEEIAQNYLNEASYSDEIVSINILNDDCLMHIFLSLPIMERVKTEEVCKRWRAVGEESWHAVKKLDLSYSMWGVPLEHRQSKITTSNLRKVLMRCGKFLNHIDFANQLHSLSPSTLTILGKFCPNLQIIDVTGLTITPAGINSLTQHCNNILKFSLSGITSGLDNHLTKLFKANKNLKYLKIINGNISKCLLHLPFDSIEEIVLNNCFDVQTIHFSSALSKCKNLTSLSVKDCFCFSDYLIEAIGTHCKNLTTLELTGNFALLYKDLHPEILHCITNLINLEKLNVSKNNVVTDDLLIVLASKCTKLTFLDISGIPQITNIGLSAIATLPHLEHLIMNNMTQITDRGLEGTRTLKKLICQNCSSLYDPGMCSVINTNSNLEYLDLSGCKQITNKILEEAANATHKRTNNTILKIFIGDTSIITNEFLKVSPLLQIVQVSLADLTYESSSS